MNYYQDTSDYIPGANKPILLRTINNEGWAPSGRIQDNKISPDKLNDCTIATEACHFFCSVKNECPLYKKVFGHLVE